MQEASGPGITIAYMARQHCIPTSLLFHWRRRMAEGGKEAIRVDEEVVGSSEAKILDKRIRELERVLGNKTPENETLREVVKAANEKNHLALAVITRRRFPVKTVADTLGVSRSQLHSRLRQGSRPRRQYKKARDAEILASFRTLTDYRPTYGYRRAWAPLNRQRESAGLSTLNHKRNYRLTSKNDLLLQRYTGKPPGRAHDGQIITIQPNMRRTSDGLEVACWDGAIVRVAFALDTCDREVISWVATTGGITGAMIRNLSLEIVERRLGEQQPPYPVGWLSDNGSCYRAHDTVSFAQSIGLVPYFTPVRSPQSNGMAESFVKTFKRDYVYVHDHPDAQSVLAQLPLWFEDHNDNHPHRALKIKSHREFIRRFHQPAAHCAV